MKNGDEPELRYPSRTPIFYGVFGTLTAVFAGVLIWLDNQEGFRSAEAFTTLISAEFSMISTIWLVVAVFRQGEEIRFQREEISLQRRELELQRIEFHRQSDEFVTLNRQNATQMNVVLRKDIEESLSNYLLTDIKRISEYENNARSFAASYLQNFTGFQVEPNQVSIFLDKSSYYINPDRDFINLVSKRYPNFKNMRYIKIPSNNEGELKALYQDKVIKELYEQAKTHGLESWFLNALPFTMRPISGVARNQIATVIRSNLN